jgi:hypothetical protein
MSLLETKGIIGNIPSLHLLTGSSRPPPALPSARSISSKILHINGPTTSFAQQPHAESEQVECSVLSQPYGILSRRLQCSPAQGSPCAVDDA